MNKYSEFSKAKSAEPAPSGQSAGAMLSQCFKKKRYSTIELATKVATNAATRAGYEIRVYSCPICAKWHLTKQPIKLGVER